MIWEGHTPHLRIIQITSIEPGSTTVQVTLSISNVRPLTDNTDLSSGSEISNLFYDKTILCRQDPYGYLIPGLRPEKTSQFIRYQPPLNISSTPTVGFFSESVIKNQKFIKSEEIKYQHPYCPTISMANSLGLLNPVNAIAMYTTSGIARASTRKSLQLTDTSTWRSDGLSDPSVWKGGKIYGKAFDAITTTPTKNSAMLNYASVSTMGAEANDSSKILYCTTPPHCTGLVRSHELIGLNFHVPSLASGSTVVMRLAYTFSTITTLDINRVEETKETLALQANAFTFTADFLNGDDSSIYVLIRPLLWAVSPSIGDAGAEEDASCLAAPILLKTSLYVFFNGGEDSKATWLLESTTSAPILTLTSSAAGLTEATGKRCETPEESSDRVFLLALPVNTIRYRTLSNGTALHCRVMFNFLLPGDVGISFVSSSLYSQRNLELNRREILVDTTATIATTLRSQSMSFVLRNCGLATSKSPVIFYSAGCSISFAMTNTSKQLLGVNKASDIAHGLVSLQLHREVLIAGTVASALLAVYSPATLAATNGTAPYLVELDLGDLTEGTLVLLKATSLWSDRGKLSSTLVGVVSKASNDPYSGRPSSSPNVRPSRFSERPTFMFPDKLPSLKPSSPSTSQNPQFSLKSNVPTIVPTHSLVGPAPAALFGSHQTNTLFYPLLSLLAIPLLWVCFRNCVCEKTTQRCRRHAKSDPKRVSSDQLKKNYSKICKPQNYTRVSELHPEHRPASPQVPNSSRQPQRKALIRISTCRDSDNGNFQIRRPIKRTTPDQPSKTTGVSRVHHLCIVPELPVLASQLPSLARHASRKALQPFAHRNKVLWTHTRFADESFSSVNHVSCPAQPVKAGCEQDMSIHVPAMVFSHEGVEREIQSSSKLYRKLNHVPRPSIRGRQHFLFQVDQAMIRRKHMEENV